MRPASSNMKPLLPTLKEKKRYIGFEVISKSVLQSKVLKDAISNGVKDYMGELGLAKAGFSIISLKQNQGIIRVGNAYVNDAKAALVLIKNIEKESVCIRSITTSGTLANVRKKLSGE